MSRFTRLLALSTLISPALLLSACGTYNGGLESANQPVVQRNDYVFDVATQGDVLAPGETDRLSGWLQSLRLRYGDHVAVDDGGDGHVARADVAALAGKYGMMLSDKAPSTVGQIAPGTVRVIVTRMSADVPQCPDYSRTYQPDYSASTSSNYGCAVNRNLAAMVADPADLVRGESGSNTADPLTSAKAIQALRSAAPTGGGGTQVKSDSTGGSSPK